MGVERSRRVWSLLHNLISLRGSTASIFQMSAPKSRLLQLAKVSAKIFDQNFNPTNARTGAKILAQRLKGPTLANYYGNPDFIKFTHLKKLYPGYNFVDESEEYRLTMIDLRKRRGKGAPTKKREASGETKKTKKRK